MSREPESSAYNIAAFTRRKDGDAVIDNRTIKRVDVGDLVAVKPELPGTDVREANAEMANVMRAEVMAQVCPETAEQLQNYKRQRKQMLHDAIQQTAAR